jgi:hypothetical protein
MSGGSSTTQNTNQQATTTTQLPSWLTDAGQAVAAKAINTPVVGAYTGQMTAGPSANQTAASTAAAANAGSWQGDLATSRAMTTAAAAAPAASVGNYQTGTTNARAAQAPTFTVGSTPQATAAQAGATMAGTTMAGAARATAAQAGPAAMQTSQGYTAATAPGGGAPTVTARDVTGSTFDSAAAQRYMNPYTQAVTQDTLAQMDKSNASDRQAQDDNIQAAGAYGGTRQAVLDAQLASDQATARNSYINSSNEAAYTNAQGQFNTDRTANDALAVGNADRHLTADTSTASFLDNLLGRQDAAAQFTAGAANTASGANADRAQAINLANAGYDQDTREANAGRAQQTGLTNASASNATSEANAGRAQAASEANAGRAQDASEANAGRQQQTNLSNQSALNTGSEANADRQQQTSITNAGAANTTAAANASRALQSDTTNASEYDTMLSRLLQGGQALGQTAEATSALGSKDIANLASTGATDQDTQNAALSAAYQEYLRAGNAPLDNAKDIMAILAGAPRNVTTTGNTTGTTTTKQQSSLLSSILGAATTGASIFSDRRLKTDISQIDNLDNGLGVYRYRYVWDRKDEPEHIGVMADEVERIMPEALGPIVNGFKTVNYGMLGELLPC